MCHESHIIEDGTIISVNSKLCILPKEVNSDIKSLRKGERLDTEILCNYSKQIISVKSSIMYTAMLIDPNK